MARMPWNPKDADALVPLFRGLRRAVACVRACGQAGVHARARTHTHAGGVHMRVWAGVPVVQHRRVRKKRAEAVRAGEMLRDRDKPVGTMHALMNMQRSNSCQAEFTLQSLRLVPMRINAGCSVLD